MMSLLILREIVEIADKVSTLDEARSAHIELRRRVNSLRDAIKEDQAKALQEKAIQDIDEWDD